MMCEFLPLPTSFDYITNNKQKTDESFHVQLITKCADFGSVSI